MPKSRTTIVVDGTRARLYEPMAAVRREGESAEADPFNQAIVTGVVGLANVLEVNADAIAKVEAWFTRMVQGAKTAE